MIARSFMLDGVAMSDPKRPPEPEPQVPPPRPNPTQPSPGPQEVPGSPEPLNIPVDAPEDPGYREPPGFPAGPGDRTG
jgi:hypothetical protein